MARRNKRAWNMSNPLYRYLHKSKSQGGTMARRRRHSRSSGFRRHSRKSGSNLLMKGLVGNKVPFGLLGLVAAGAVYSMFISPMVPKVAGNLQTPVTEAAVLGGAPAAAGALIASNIGMASSAPQQARLY